jgi:hypothetical protein
LQRCSVAELRRPALSRATASLDVRRGGLQLVSPSRAPHGKVRCITSHQSQPPVHNQWSRLVYFGLCALLEYWTPTHSSRHLLLVQCRSRKNGVSTARCRGTSKPDVYISPMYIDIHTCVSMHVYVHYYCLHTFIYRYMYTCSAITSPRKKSRPTCRHRIACAPAPASASHVQ